MMGSVFNVDLGSPSLAEKQFGERRGTPSSIQDMKGNADASQTLLHSLPLISDEHVVALRKATRDIAIELKLSLVDQTKLVTAASELARNTIKYGGGGVADIHMLSDGVNRGVQLAFIDQGPGIADVAQAMQDGFTSGGGLGLGLGGSKRLVDEFNIVTAPGQGTTITIGKWKR